MTPAPHPAVTTLRRKTLNVDDEWSEDLPGGFRWWPYRQCQRIVTDLEKEFLDGACHRRIVVETDVAYIREPARSSLDERLVSLAKFATLSGLVLGADEVLRLHSHVWVSAATLKYGEKLLATAAGLQIFEAAFLALEIAREGLGSPADTPHPANGWRPEPDEIARVTELVVQLEGGKRSKFDGDELSNVEEAYLGRRPCLLGTVGDDGLTAEFPFGRKCSLLRIKTAWTHPLLGNGMLVHNAFRLDEEAGAGGRVVSLNAAEVADGDGNFLGSWFAERGVLHFLSFVPNLVAGENVLTNFFLYGAQRARFASVLLRQDDWSSTWNEQGNCRAKTRVEELVEEQTRLRPPSTGSDAEATPNLVARKTRAIVAGAANDSALPAGGTAAGSAKRPRAKAASVDYSYRPDTYWPDDAEVSGSNLEEVSAAFDLAVLPILTEEQRAHLDQAHFSLSGRPRAERVSGFQVFPVRVPGAVEIAKIHLRGSVNDDVVSVQAFRRSSGRGSRIGYQVVDDYGSEFVFDPVESAQPLTLGELVRLIDRADQGPEFTGLVFGYLEYNTEMDDLEAKAFIRVSSVFYPQIEKHYVKAIASWVREREAKEREGGE